MVDTPAQRRAAAGLFAGAGSGAYDTRTPGVGYALPIPAPTVQPIDPSTHLWTPVWYQWLLSLSRAIGTSALVMTRYSSDNSIVLADPGQGDIRWNNATQANATKLAISDRAAGGGNPRLRALWTRSLVGDRIFLQDNSSNTVFQVWEITSIIDHSTWFEVDARELVASSGGNLTGQIDVFVMRG